MRRCVHVPTEPCTGFLCPMWIAQAGKCIYTMDREELRILHETTTNAYLRAVAVKLLGGRGYEASPP